MKQLFALLALAVAVSACAFCVPVIAQAQQPGPVPQPQFAQPPAAQPPAGPPVAARPQYLFLAPSYHAYGQFVPAQAYAYGWFGVCARPQAVFHWDYFDHRWIWR